MNERKTHMRYQLVATMAAGLESVTTKELKALGIQTRTENGKVYFEGDDKTIALTNVWLRSADRIKIVVGQFKALTLMRFLKALRRYLGITTYRLTQRSRLRAERFVRNYIQNRTFKAITKKQLLKKCLRFIIARRGYRKLARLTRWKFRF